MSSTRRLAGFGMALAAALVMFAAPGGIAAACAQGMTGPIDLGTIQLNRSQMPPAPLPPRKSQSAAASAAGPAVDIKAFYGQFVGSGFADGDDAAYFGMTQRDLDVQIAPSTDGGFTLAWTTVLRQGGDPKAPDVRRRTATVTFLPGPRPGLFRATDNGDPLTGGILSWAHIARSTLTMHQFSVLPDGRHEIQTYARTLSGTGMDLVYTRVVDGERQRRVRGKLVKNAK